MGLVQLTLIIIFDELASSVHQSQSKNPLYT